MSWWDRLFGRRESPQLPDLERQDEVPAVRLVRWGERRSDSVISTLTGLGGPYDKGSSARPNTLFLPLLDEEIVALWEAGGLPRRVVELLPSRATRKGWVVNGIDERQNEDLGVYDAITWGATWGRLLGGAIVVMVTADGRDPSEPLTGPADLVRLDVCDAYQAQIAEWDRDYASRTYGEPMMWHVSKDDFWGQVHHSRVLWFRGARRLPSHALGGRYSRNRMPDASVLQPIWEQLRRIETTSQAGANAAQELRVSVLKVRGLAEKQTSEEAATFGARMQAFWRTLSAMGMGLLDAGGSDGKGAESFESSTHSPTGFEELSQEARTMLSAVSGIPQVVLFGVPPAGLSSDDESGHESFRQLVSDYQERELRPELTKLYRVMGAPDDLVLTFGPLDEPDAETLARLKQMYAEIDSVYITDGVISPEDARNGRFGPDGWNAELTDVKGPSPEEYDKRLGFGQPEDPEAEDDPDEDPAAAERDDAGDGVCVLVPAPDPGLASRVSRAIGQPLDTSDMGGAPHVTVLYLGAGLDASEVSEVSVVVAEEAARMTAHALGGGAVRAFPHGEYGTPIVVEFEDAWALDSLNAYLTRRLAHVVRARQFPRYRAHLTIGYAPEPLSPEAAAALLEVDVSGVRVPVAEVRVMAGGTQVASAQLGS